MEFYAARGCRRRKVMGEIIAKDREKAGRRKDIGRMRERVLLFWGEMLKKMPKQE